MRTPFGEFQAGASDEICDHSGNKNLARSAMCHDASCGVNGNAADIPTSHFDFAGMQTSAQRAHNPVLDSGEAEAARANDDQRAGR
jgi:hypothetical protein